MTPTCQIRIRTSSATWTEVVQKSSGREVGLARKPAALELRSPGTIVHGVSLVAQKAHQARCPRQTRRLFRRPQLVQTPKNDYSKVLRQATLNTAHHAEREHILKAARWSSDSAASLHIKSEER